ncbi:MAG: hypothetical protein ACW99V_06985 [Candidatus Thorarchaeota archaeon]|jgi:2-keto-4-pentenoate hydratase
MAKEFGKKTTVLIDGVQWTEFDILTAIALVLMLLELEDQSVKCHWRTGLMQSSYIMIM